MKPFIFAAILALNSFTASAFAKERATTVRSVDLHASANDSSEKLMVLERGADLAVLQQRNADNQPWLQVSVSVPGATENQPAREVTGWIAAKPVVFASTGNGDQIVYGEAVDSEQQAEKRGGRRGAAEDAMRLYFEVAQLFPNSPLAGEALWRSADIRWQLDKARGKAALEERFLQEVISKFPRTKWADLAAFDLLDKDLCGAWNGLPECPTKEAEAYERYAREHPQSPKFGEALFNAAFRQGSLVDIYRIANDKEKSNAAHNKALALAQELADNAAQGEWRFRAADLVYKLQQNIALYGVSE
jgi:hypothetical protein